MQFSIYTAYKKHFNIAVCHVDSSGINFRTTGTTSTKESNFAVRCSNHNIVDYCIRLHFTVIDITRTFYSASVIATINIEIVFHIS